MGAQIQCPIQLVEHVYREEVLAQQQLIRTVSCGGTAQQGHQVKGGGRHLFRILDDDNAFGHITVRRKQPIACREQA